MPAPTTTSTTADGGHAHGVSASSDARWLLVALLINLGFMVVEVAVGIAANSLALLSDAAHMLTDAAAIGLAILALRLAQRPPKGAFTFGLKRGEILSAQINGVLLFVLAGIIGIEAITRIVNPPDVDGAFVLYTGPARGARQRRRGLGARQGQPREPQRAGRVPAQPLRHALVDRGGGRRPRDRAVGLGPGRRDRRARPSRC